LDRRPREESFEVFGPVGRYVAVLAAGGDPRISDDDGQPYTDGEYATLLLIDLRSGDGYLVFKGGTFVGIGGPLEVFLRPTGTMAIVKRPADSDFRLMVCEFPSCYTGRRAATFTTLDTSKRAFQNVRLTGRLLTWTNDGAAQSATIN
jgi:hypothetical protein